jgi:hypothetical protein
MFRDRHRLCIQQLSERNAKATDRGPSGVTTSFLLNWPIHDSTICATEAVVHIRWHCTAWLEVLWKSDVRVLHQTCSRIFVVVQTSSIALQLTLCMRMLVWRCAGPSVDFRLFWHVYVLVGAYFVWPWKSREASVTLTSHRGHWPLLIRVSDITWCGSKLLGKLYFIRVT